MSTKTPQGLLVICLMAALTLGTSTLAAQTSEANQDQATSESDSSAEVPADDQPPEDESLPSFFEATTVTATGSEASAFEIATPVNVVTLEAVQKRLPENASDLLRDQPGVDVNGVGPNQSRPVIRGQRGLRVLFMENGLRMNNARRQTDFGEIPGLVDLESVQAVEVVRGPASVLYGSDAIGGVLNLISRVPQYQQGTWGKATLAGRYASASEQFGLHASVDGRVDRFSFRTGYTLREAEDYQAPAGRFGDIELEDDAPVNDSGIKDDAWTGEIGFALSSSQDAFLRWNRYRAEDTGFGYVDPALIGSEDGTTIRILYPFQDFDRYTLGYRASALSSLVADSFEVQAYYQDNERELVNDIDINIGPIFPGAPNSTVAADTQNFTDIETLGLRAETIKVAGKKHLLTYGLEIFRDETFNTDSSVTTTTIRFPFPPFEIVDVATDTVPNAPNAENTSYGIFIQDEIDVLPRLTLSLGARYQNVDTRARETPGWDVSGLDFSDDALVGAIGAVFSLREDLNIVASYGTAFRAPNIVERLFNGPTPEGIGYQLLNPDLQSEQSANIDLGLKFQRRNAYAELFFFRNDIDDGIIQYFLSDEEIAALPQDVQDEIAASGASSVVQQRNLDSLRYEGIELAAGYRTDMGLAVGGNYTHLDGQRRDRGNPPTGDALADKINAWIRYEPPMSRFWVEYRVRHNGSQPSTVDPNEPIPPVGETIPSFTVHTLAGGVLLFRGARQEHVLNLMVDNLTNELYAEFSNATFFRPQPKRSFVANYRFAF